MNQGEVVSVLPEGGLVLTDHNGEVVVVTSATMPDGSVYLEPMNVHQQSEVMRHIDAANVAAQAQTQGHTQKEDQRENEDQEDVTEDGDDYDGCPGTVVSSGLTVVKAEPVYIDHSYLPEQTDEVNNSHQVADQDMLEMGQALASISEPDIEVKTTPEESVDSAPSTSQGTSMDETESPDQKGQPHYHYKVAYSIKEVREIIKRVEEVTGVHFITLRSLKHYGIEEGWNPYIGDRRPDKSHGRICWHFGENVDKEQQPYGMMNIPFDGVPFIHVSSLACACQYFDQNKCLEKKKKIDEYRKKVAAGEIEHIEPPPRKPRPTPPKKKKSPTLAEGMTVSRPDPVPALDHNQDHNQEINMAAQTLEMMQGNHVYGGDYPMDPSFPFDDQQSQYHGPQHANPLFKQKRPSPGSEPRKRVRIRKPKKKLPLPPGITMYRKTKKTGCKAAITVKQVAKFPEYRIPITSGKSSYLTRTVSEQIRNAFKKDVKSVKVQMTYYIRIPDLSMHIGHEVASRPPLYKSPSHVNYLLSHLYKFKDARGLASFADIRFNLEGQKRQLKLHSVVLAASGLELRKSLIEGDYTKLAEIMKPLDQVTLDTFVSFLYRGEMEIQPQCNVAQLREAFVMAGVKDGVTMCDEHTSAPKVQHPLQWALSYEVARNTGKEDASTQTWLSNVHQSYHVTGEDPFKSNTWGSKVNEKIRKSSQDKSDTIRRVVDKLFPAYPPHEEMDTINNLVEKGCSARSIIKFLVLDRFKDYGIGLIKELEKELPEGQGGNVIALDPANFMSRQPKPLSANPNPAQQSVTAIVRAVPAPPEIKVTLSEDHIRIQAPPDVIKLLKQSEQENLAKRLQKEMTKEKNSESERLAAAGHAVIEAVVPEAKLKPAIPGGKNSQVREKYGVSIGPEGMKVVKADVPPPKSQPDPNLPNIKILAQTTSTVTSGAQTVGTPTSEAKTVRVSEGNTSQIQWTVGPALKPPSSSADTTAATSGRTQILLPLVHNISPQIPAFVSAVPVVYPQAKKVSPFPDLGTGDYTVTAIPNTNSMGRPGVPASAMASSASTTSSASTATSSASTSTSSASIATSSACSLTVAPADSTSSSNSPIETGHGKTSVDQGGLAKETPDRKASFKVTLADDHIRIKASPDVIKLLTESEQGRLAMGMVREKIKSTESANQDAKEKEVKRILEGLNPKQLTLSSGDKSKPHKVVNTVTEPMNLVITGINTKGKGKETSGSLEAGCGKDTLERIQNRMNKKTGQVDTETRFELQLTSEEDSPVKRGLGGGAYDGEDTGIDKVIDKGRWKVSKAESARAKLLRLMESSRQLDKMFEGVATDKDGNETVASVASKKSEAQDIQEIKSPKTPQQGKKSPRKTPHKVRTDDIDSDVALIRSSMGRRLRVVLKRADDNENELNTELTSEQKKRIKLEPKTPETVKKSTSKVDNSDLKTPGSVKKFTSKVNKSDSKTPEPVKKSARGVDKSDSKNPRHVETSATKTAKSDSKTPEPATRLPSKRSSSAVQSTSDPSNKGKTCTQTPKAGGSAKKPRLSTPTVQADTPSGRPSRTIKKPNKFEL